MLTPLVRALGAWAPGGVRGLAAAASREQALGEIFSLWPQIVGEDVAAHAAPLERSGDALVVLVSSSAWSNQLSLLSAAVIRSLREAGIEGIERLRFRTGRSRPAPAAASGGRSDELSPAAESGVPSEPAASLEEAFSRFRERVARARDAKQARGWKQCSKCGAMLPEGDRCSPCATAEVSARSALVQRLMFDVPWLGFRGTAELVEGLSHEEYEANRTALLARWWEALTRARKTGILDPGGYERQVASSYLLLKTGWEPDRITPVISRNELTDEIHEMIYGKRHE